MNFDGSARDSNRTIGLSFVVVFHIVLIWALVNGLGHKAIELLPAPMETKIIEEIKPPKEEPPPPKPAFEPPPPPYIPPPDINIATPVEATAAITQTTSVKPVAAAPPEPAPKKAVHISPSIDFKGSSRACREPEYPSASERLSEAGTAAISLLIGADGSVQQSKIDLSSGFKRLDDATVKAFGKCKFVVGTTDGKPEASWFSMKYKWVVPK